MQRLLICSGVLGGGTALVFALAATVSVVLPPTRYVPANQSVMVLRGMDVTAPAIAGAVTLDTTWAPPPPALEPVPVETPR
jgi:hypothetical protein